MTGDRLTRTKVRAPERCRCCGAQLAKGDRVFLVGGIKIEDRFCYVCIPCGELPEAEHAQRYQQEGGRICV